jgi:putative sugar O-methyltransferase
MPNLKTPRTANENYMLKLKHLRHPLRTASVVRTLAAEHWNMRRLASQGERRFRNDARYDLQSVTDGFASHLEDRRNDTALLERICTAYNKAMAQQRFAKPAYHATNWWKAMRNAGVEPVQRALAAGDTRTLQAMYENFYRDSCSAGLVGVPFQMAKAYNGARLKDTYRRFFLSDALHRIDYWKSQTGDRFDLRELAGPEVGNPFGVQIEGTFVRTGAEYQHYCAQRICDLLPAGDGFVVEIGGGFGGMAYYLLRDRPALRYADFDVPESLALTSYYLLKAFSRLNFLLYGEEEFAHGFDVEADLKIGHYSRASAHARRRSDIILMPVFELGKLAAKSVDLTFSSHAMSDLSSQATAEYMDEIARTTRKYLLYIGHSAAGAAFQKLVRARYPAFTLVEKCDLEWNSLKFVDADEVELLYRVNSE